MRAPLAALLLLLPTCASLQAVDFNHQVVPLLRKHCGECHTGNKLKGGFSMNDRNTLLHGSENGPVIDPKNPAASLLLKVVTTDDKDTRMPPKGERLSAEEVAVLRQWIADGTPWEPGFAFKAPAYDPPLKPRTVPLPQPTPGRENPVDRLVDSYLAKNQIPTPATVDDGAFLRRAHLDLIGLLPTPEEFTAFTSDQRPDKRQRLITSLLARDVDYAEHWLTFWNDLLRNDYGGTGFITGGRKQISAWLYSALVQNIPYNQFATELLNPPTDQSRGFIDGIKWRGNVSAGQTVEIQFAQSLGQSFLGINLKCASCHDSFIDRWKLDESYGLAAVYAEKPLEIHRCDKPVGRTASAAWLFPELGRIDPAAPRPERLKQLAALMTHPDNGRFTRTIVNRLWHRLMGRGLVHPLDAMQSEPWNADLLDFLADDFQKHGYNLRHTLALIASSQAYAATTEVVSDQSGPYTFRGPRARRLTAEQFVDALWHISHSGPAKVDAPILRGKADPATIDAARSRISAAWIWGDSAAAGKIPPSGEKILLRTTWKLDAPPSSGTAVLTCDNAFTLYINNKRVAESPQWEQLTSVPLHDKLQKGDNQIVVAVSNAGSSPNPAGLFLYAEASLTNGSRASLSSNSSWEFSPSTLKGNEARLGKLPDDWKPATEVPALAPWSAAISSQGPSLLAQAAAGAHLPPRAALMKADFFMRSLGRPNRDQIVSMRPAELTTLEAIDLSNGEVLFSALNKGAQQLTARPWKDSAELVHWIYAQTLARKPTTDELTAALDALGREKPAPAAVADLLWAILMQPEFQYVR